MSSREEGRGEFRDPVNKATPVLHGLLTDDIIIVDLVGSLVISPDPEYKPLSVAPPQVSYELPDPRNGVAFDEGMIQRHDLIEDRLYDALKYLKEDYTGNYCLERRFEQTTESNSNINNATSTSSSTATVAAVNTFYVLDGRNFMEKPAEDRDLKRICEFLQMGLSFNPPDDDSFKPFELEDHSEIQGAFLTTLYATIVTNPHDSWKFLAMTGAGDIKDMATFDIPPKSSFLLGPFNQCFSMFNTHSKNLGGWDLILADPPWPNRSVLRAGAYDSFNAYELFKLKAHHLAPNGMLAVWVPNNTKWVNLVVDKLFPAMRLQFEAKWMWLKVTERGEPIFDPKSVSRKPYEFLLFGRKCAKTEEPYESGKRKPEDPFPMDDKILVGVPELHSRKPCLQELIKPYLPIQSKARVCELFARNLVPGWFSWGDEVLMSNWLHYMTMLP